MTPDLLAANETYTDLGPRVARLLDLAREHLGMDIAWLSEFVEGDMTIRAGSGDLESMGGLSVGLTVPLESVYCSRVIAGTLPNVIPDLRREPLTRDLPVTADTGAGAYIGVPLRRQSGEPMGMLCCLNRSSRPDLDESAAQFLGLIVAAMAEDIPDWAVVQQTRRQQTRARLASYLRDGSLRAVFQPVMSLTTSQVIGYEALTRIETDHAMSPAQLFADALDVGMAAELEAAAVMIALEHLDAVPADCWLSVNLSPTALLFPRVQHAIVSRDPQRVVVELTEHAQVADYAELNVVTRSLRESGVRIAVDDAGAGFASLQHILQVRPDIIKLDISITRDVHLDPVRQALASSLQTFADTAGAILIAEGVECTGELDTLTTLGIDAVQGYLLARPGRLDQPVHLVQPTRRRVDLDGLLDEVLDAAAAAPDLESFMVRALDTVLGMTDMQVAAVWPTMDETPLVVRTEGPLQVPADISVSWPAGLADACVQRHLTWTSDAARDLPELATEPGLPQRFLCVPLTAADGWRNGLLLAASAERCTLTHDAQLLVLMVAKIAARWLDVAST